MNVSRAKALPSALAAIAAQQGGPFTAEQAQRLAGYSRGHIRYHVRTGTWVALRRGVYVDRRTLEACGDSDDRLHAVCVAAAFLGLGSAAGSGGLRPCPGHQAADAWPSTHSPALAGSHQSAARIWGIDLLHRPQALTLTREPAAKGSNSTPLPGLLVHRAVLPLADVSVRHHVPVTSAARTIVDLARALPFLDAVVAADSALRGQLTSQPELRNVIAACAHWPGIRQAARAVEFADQWAESVLESIARVVFAEQGLPAPQTQALIIDGAEIVARADFLWDEYRTIAEADGLLKYSTSDVLRAEKLRQDRLAELGYEVVRVTWTQITKHPAETAERIRRAFARAAGRQGLPRMGVAS